MTPKLVSVTGDQHRPVSAPPHGPVTRPGTVYGRPRRRYRLLLRLLRYAGITVLTVLAVLVITSGAAVGAGITLLLL